MQSKEDIELANAIAEMNALPDISGNDSKEFRKLQDTAIREVKLHGGTQADTTLEMIGLIRQREIENKLLRDTLRTAHANLDLIFSRSRDDSILFEMLRKIEKPMADTLYAVEGIPVDYSKLRLQCPVCGAADAFTIDTKDGSRGYCAAEDSTWTIRPVE